ncbi:MAG: hypothetical protein GY711_24515 [bacterium]|nr:hypothetical protein [bacterium]
MSLAEKIDKSLEKKWCTRFQTSHPDGDAYDGVVTVNHRNLIVLRNLQHFEFDGVVILPKRVIRGYRDSRFERCLNRVLRHNQAIREARTPDWLESCDDLESLLNALGDRDIWPIVEMLYEEEGEIGSALYIGPIDFVDEDGFGLQCYDAAGKWETVYELDFEDVFKIEFGDSYSKHFNNYMRDKSPPPELD